MIGSPGTVVNTETAFSVVGTPASLLAEAPPLGRPFRREVVFEAGVLGPLVDRMTPRRLSQRFRARWAVAKNRQARRSAD
jgi:hypothetical protein